MSAAVSIAPAPASDSDPAADFERRVNRMVHQREAVERHARWLAAQHGLDEAALVSAALATFERQIGTVTGHRARRARVHWCRELAAQATYRRVAEMLGRAVG